MNASNDGKYLVVTGAASGIGAAVADLAGADGWTVARLDREFVTGGDRYQVDVADIDSVSAVLASITQVWGRPPDALVHAAGIYRLRAATDVDTRTWEETMTVNARGSFLMARVTAQAMMRANSGGSVVLLGSVGSMRGDVAEPAAVYAASKGAVSALVRQLAVEWGGAGIRVNAVMPGVIDTPMTRITDDPAATAGLLSRLPLGRLGRAEEVAAACLFLAGPAAGYITGTEMVVDGGYLVS